MYAGDLADFIYFAIDQIDSLPSLVNVGLGQDYTINEYYQTIAAVLGYEGEFVHDLTKPVGMQQKLVDTTRLHELGWAPRTSLTEGIKHTYQFYMDGKNG
jgi:GDP-L-fucose synthase